MVTSSYQNAGGAGHDHRYELFEAGRSIGWLEWRPVPRERLGWYLVRHDGEPLRLRVDLTLDDLATAERRDQHDWELAAEVAALLSTALALDAAERALHPRADQRRRPPLPQPEGARLQIFTSGLEPRVLGRAVPELPVAAVAEVVMLEGQLGRAAREAVIRRIQLLGGRVLAVLPVSATSEAHG